MTINFEGVTNKPYTMVMAGIFVLKDGTELAISSDYVSFSLTEIDEEEAEKLEIEENEGDIEEGGLCKFEMSWKLCYIFDPNNENDDILYYLTFNDVKPFKDVELSSYLIHEDAPEDYYVRFTRVYPF